MIIGNKHNSDNVFSRAVTVGLINLLNNKIQYENYLSESDSVDVIEVPWFFNQAGDEKFMQDFFVHWDNCIHPKLATGNYDIIPRGVAKLVSENIDSGSLTSRFVRGTQVKEINGELQTFSSYINSIPLIINYECSIETDTYLDALKIRQVILEIFYAVQVFYVTYKGVKVPCQVSFPESVGLEKTFEYTYGDETKTFLNFDLEMQTYQPVFDKSTERHNSNRMQKIGTGISVDKKLISSIEIRLPLENDEFFSGQEMNIIWKDVGTILRVDIAYQINSNNEWIPIENSIINSGFYKWQIQDFHEFRAIAVFNQQTKFPANLKIFVNGLGEIEDIIILDGGNNYTNELTITAEENKEGITQAVLNPIIVNGKIENVEIINPGSGYTPTQEFEIKIRVRDTNNTHVFSEIDNIKIR